MTAGEYPGGQLPGTETPACWLAVVPLATPSAPARLDIAGDGATSTTCGPCTALFQGVLFDREELAKRLPDGCPEPRNDAALVIDAYRQWDEDFLSHINGVFSLVVWDASRNTLLIARDPVGTIGLYYTRTASDLVAAPTLTEVLDHPGVSREFNRYAVAEHLSHRWLRREETYFARIFRLPPGHVLRLRDGTQTIRKYRDRFPSTRRIDWATEQDLETFDDLFVRAVRRCLRGPAGINLSGGLDSVSIAAVAVEEARRMGLPVPRAFGIAFPDSLSEEDTQRSVAQRLGLPVGSSRVDLQACKLEYSIVSPK